MSCDDADDADDAHCLDEPSRHPCSWSEFLDWFPDDRSCVAHLQQLRWGDGFRCPSCGVADAAQEATRLRLVCRSCAHQTTATAGTIFQGTRISLRSWFAAAWYVTNHPKGISAVGLQKVLGLGSYQTAWAMLHKLRRAMAVRNEDRLNGVIEIAHTEISARPNSRRPRDGCSPLVGIAVDVGTHPDSNRAMLGVLSEHSAEGLAAFVVRMVEPGSIVLTEQWAECGSLSDCDHTYRPLRGLEVGQEGSAAQGSQPVVSLLRRSLLRTYQSSVGSSQLEHYLSEFSFRFNRRDSPPGLLFGLLLERAVATEPTSYRDMIA